MELQFERALEMSDDSWKWSAFRGAYCSSEWDLAVEAASLFMQQPDPHHLDQIVTGVFWKAANNLAVRDIIKPTEILLICHYAWVGLTRIHADPDKAAELLAKFELTPKLHYLLDPDRIVDSVVELFETHNPDEAPVQALSAPIMSLDVKSHYLTMMARKHLREHRAAQEASSN